jgi:hypothetical protein
MEGDTGSDFINVTEQTPSQGGVDVLVVIIAIGIVYDERTNPIFKILINLVILTFILL